MRVIRVARLASRATGTKWRNASAPAAISRQTVSPALTDEAHLKQ